MKVTYYKEISKCDTAESRASHMYYDDLTFSYRLVENKTCTDLFGIVKAFISNLPFSEKWLTYTTSEIFLSHTRRYVSFERQSRVNDPNYFYS